MNISSLILVIVSLGCFILTMVVANQSESQRREIDALRYLLYGLISAAVAVSFVALQADLVAKSAARDGAPQVDMLLVQAIANFAFTTLAGTFAFAMFRSRALRLRVERLLQPAGLFNADSPVHATALVLMLVVVSLNLSSFILGGGLEGLASAVEMQTYSLGDVAFNQLLWLFLAFLGVGLFIRRDLKAALVRLGLRVPTRADLGWGILTGVGATALLFLFGDLLQMLTPQDQLEAQNAASNYIAGAFSTLGLAFVGMIMVAIGEEVFFRGAIQPVFGIFASSIFFTLLHSQYLFTPATVALFIVSLMFGWVRRRHSTSASITAHFVYNFIQLALALLASTALEQAAGVVR